MALPLYAFTTLNGQEWAVVARSTVDEDHRAFTARAQQIIIAIASRGPSGLWPALDKHLQVVPLATAMKEPYWRYRNTPFDEAWLQSQYAAMVSRTYNLNPQGWDLD